VFHRCRLTSSFSRENDYNAKSIAAPTPEVNKIIYGNSHLVVHFVLWVSWRYSGVCQLYCLRERGRCGIDRAQPGAVAAVFGRSADAFGLATGHQAGALWRIPFQTRPVSRRASTGYPSSKTIVLCGEFSTRRTQVAQKRVIPPGAAQASGVSIVSLPGPVAQGHIPPEVSSATNGSISAKSTVPSPFTSQLANRHAGGWPACCDS
jgi:hypothetical protein